MNASIISNKFNLKDKNLKSFRIFSQKYFLLNKSSNKIF